MWHIMSECHHIQCLTLYQAKNIESTITLARFNETPINLVQQLELQLLDMTTSFIAWFNARKPMLALQMNGSRRKSSMSYAGEVASF